MNIKNALKTLDRYEQVIWDIEQEFLDIFCHSADYLVSVSWNSRSVKIVYILSSGQHIADEKPVQYVIDFVEEYWNRSEK